MTRPTRAVDSAAGIDPVLDNLIEEFARKLQGGEPVTPEAYAREHPERGDELARILPAMVVLADLGSSANRGIPTALPAAVGTLGDFRIVREVGRGGMGVVYEAVQISLGRRVALKVLPFAATLDARQLQRFKNEAQAAAHLQHSNIVPVYYVGCERGVHFYAMQYVEGQTLAAAIRQLRQQAGLEGDDPVPVVGDAPGPASSPDATTEAVTPPVATLSTEPSVNSPGFFRTVARLGVQAALALEHAHQLGVIHRDIKPANLLLDLRGNLWITDFGLAHCQQQPGLTMSGDLVGTLRYMSPEQVMARGRAVDPRTDVYALGATLYEVLTREPACDGQTRQEVLHQIAFGEPRPPRRLNPGVPAELETIVLKAMGKNPEERYATAQELADDLQRFLEDRPIRARRPTLRGRAVKWARRHRVVAGAAAVVTAVAVAALAVSTILVWRQQVQTQAAYRAEAEQRRHAERNVRLALRVLDRIYLQVAERQFPRDPEREREDGQLLRQALEFYAEFVHDNSTDPEARQEIGEACLRLGDIHAKLGQAAEAEQAFRRTIALGEELAGDFPEVPDHRRQLAQAHLHLGHLFARTDRPREAEAGFRQAWNLQKRLADEFPAQPPYRKDLATTSSNLGVVLTRLGRFPQAEEECRRAVRLYEQLAEDLSEGTAFDRELALCYATLGDVLRPAGRLREAESAYRQACDHFDKLAGKGPTQPTWRDEQAGIQLNLGVLLSTAKRFEEAERAYRQAHALWNQLVEDFPAVPGYRQRLTVSLSNVGSVLNRTGRDQEAHRVWRQVLALREKLAADFPGVPKHRVDLAGTRLNLGALSWSLGRPEEAETLFRQAQALLRQLAADFPERAHRAKLAQAHHDLGALLASTGRHREAEAAYREEVALGEQLVGGFPAVPDYRQDLAADYTDLGKLLTESGRSQEAELAFARELALAEKLVADFPAMPGVQETLAAVHHNLGILREGAFRLREAEQAYRLAVELRRRLANNIPHAPEYRLGLAEAYHNLGSVLHNTDRPDEAEHAYRAAVALLEKLVADFPTRPAYRDRLATVHLSLGLLLHETGRPRKAEAAYRQALALGGPITAPSQPASERARWLADSHSRLGAVLSQTGRPAEAEAAYRRARHLAERLAADFPDRADDQHRLAGLLAGCPMVSLRDAPRAVGHAWRAVELAPHQGPYWTTLGMAHGRAGDWKAAAPALDKAMRLRSGGDSREWFYLAMARWHLDDKEQARQWYERAVGWMEKHKPLDEELHRFAAEAAALLGLPGARPAQGRKVPSGR
jgi:serine/threonine protein kinase/tetratricopeptide (TPR) repeat protein